MIVTSLSALAASVRSALNWEGSNADTRKPVPARKKSGMPGTDAVDRSKDRAELSAGAIELHKIASVQFHQLPPSAKKESTQKRLPIPNATAAAVLRRYTTGA